VQVLQDAAAARKGTFDVGHVDAETNILKIKMAQNTAEANLVGYKRQIEYLDRNAVNFAQQWLRLQSAVLKAQMAEEPPKAQNEDLKFQEARIKAQIAAAHAGGPASTRTQ